MLTEEEITFLFTELEKIFGNEWRIRQKDHQELSRFYWSKWAFGMTRVQMQNALSMCRSLKNYKYKNRPPNVHEFKSLGDQKTVTYEKKPYSNPIPENDEDLYTPENLFRAKTEMAKINAILARKKNVGR